ncbi:hypothetical protein C1H46_019436 [Malus baccata]|uniref:Uncharacterized protein n=1 Tax=Malus baccata TaxID=106549 RepID=A0A540M878_MALBA|nr:hypothetical protein C1H46_019436 [Malus baccata]
MATFSVQLVPTTTITPCMSHPRKEFVTKRTMTPSLENDEISSTATHFGGRAVRMSSIFFNFKVAEFLALCTILQNIEPRYFFRASASLQRDTYITNLPKQDNDWYKDVLVVDSEWEGKTFGIRAW